MNPTERLLSIEAIKQLKARYFRFVDTKDWAGIGTLFAEDAEFTRSGAQSVRDPWSGGLHPPLLSTPDVRTGREEIVKMIRAAVEHVRTVHHGYTPEIDILGENRATGIWAMMDEIRDRQYKLVLRGWGHYHETYERGADGWLIKTARIARLQLQLGPTEHGPERFA
jgi:ketosteroid isomerase-like protein